MGSGPGNNKPCVTFIQGINIQQREYISILPKAIAHQGNSRSLDGAVTTIDEEVSPGHEF